MVNSYRLVEVDKIRRVDLPTLGFSICYLVLIHDFLYRRTIAPRFDRNSCLYSHQYMDSIVPESSFFICFIKAVWKPQAFLLQFNFLFSLKIYNLSKSSIGCWLQHLPLILSAQIHERPLLFQILEFMMYCLVI